MLRITELRTKGRLVLKREGRLTADWVNEVDTCWRATRPGAGDVSIWVDLSDVSGVDVAGEALLARMHRRGVGFLMRGCLMRELVREISELEK